MIIRRATIKDVKELNNLLTLLIRDEKQYDENINEEFVVTNMYENYIEDTTRCILVAEDNQQFLVIYTAIVKKMILSFIPKKRS